MEKYDYKKHVTEDLYKYFIENLSEEDWFWLVNSTNNDDYECWFAWRLAHILLVNGRLKSVCATTGTLQKKHTLIFLWIQVTTY